MESKLEIENTFKNAGPFRNGLMFSEFMMITPNNDQKSGALTWFVDLDAKLVNCL